LPIVKVFYAHLPLSLPIFQGFTPLLYIDIYRHIVSTVLNKRTNGGKLALVSEYSKQSARLLLTVLP
jgi:hypothetical protein